MPEHTENHDLITTAQEAVTPYPVDHTTTGLFIVRTGSGDPYVVDLRDHLGFLPDRPWRKTGELTLTDPDSFIAALNKHGLPQTELYGDTKRGAIRAVINAHGPAEGNIEGDPGWGDHTITLRLPLTQDWQDWTNRNGSLDPQASFAEFIEDHLPNFVEPSGAETLELAQTFQATTRVNFESSQRVSSGETQLTYKEDTTARAGSRGHLAIPDTFSLALQPYERGTTYRVHARFRYRINDGRLLLGYRLTRPDDVLRDAFDAVIQQVQEHTPYTVWHWHHAPLP